MANEATPEMSTSVTGATSNKAVPATSTIQDQEDDDTQDVSSTIATISSDICGRAVTTTASTITTAKSKILESLKKSFKKCAKSSIATFKSPQNIWKMRREVILAQGSGSGIKGGQTGGALLEDLAGEEGNSTGKTFGKHGVENAAGAHQKGNGGPTNTVILHEDNHVLETPPVLAPIARIGSIGEILAG